MAFPIDDYALIGFWPLNESSGTPVFRNYAPRTANGATSGISFDLHVHATNPAIGVSVRQHQSLWPGTDTQFNFNSGIFHTGYRVQGNYNKATADIGPHEKILTVGAGGRRSKEFMTTPAIDGSGWTVGMWVLPLSNGDTTTSTNQQHGERHPIISKGLRSSTGSTSAGFSFGVYGNLSESTPNTPASRELVAFGEDFGATQFISTPIESGKFTHLTLRYEYDFSASNERLTLYKDGIVQSSSVYAVSDAFTLTAANTSFADAVLSIGGGLDTGTSTNFYEYAAGWGHLVSGVYAFERPLSDAEVLTIHGGQGLQPDEGVFPKGTQDLTLQHPELIAYYPFLSPGYVDVGPNHEPLISETDEGSVNSTFGTTISYYGITGPFGRGGAYNEAGTSRAIMASSGLMQRIIDAKSFTVAGYFAPNADSSTADVNYQRNMLFACGATDSDVTPTPTNDNMCFFVSTSGDAGTLRYSARFYEDGDTGTELALLAKEADIWRSVYSHYAVVYDDQTRGVAFYVGGYLQESGTLGASLVGQMRKVVGAGFNMTFLGSVDNTDAQGFVSNGGIDCAGSEFAIFGRPLQPHEINYLAQSGINVDSLLLTPADPRLRGYWKGTEASDENLLNVEDRAVVWEKNPANLTQVQSDFWWDDMYTQINTTPPYGEFPLFNQVRPTPSDPQQASFGNLGMTSGVWAMRGGSPGNMGLTAAIVDEKLSSYGAPPVRFRPFMSERDGPIPHYANSFLLSFEVTPSGVIHAQGVAGNSAQYNSRIIYFGNGNANEDYIVHLEQASGVIQAVLTGRYNATNRQVLFAPNLPYGAPSRVTFWIRPDIPYVMDSLAGADDLRATAFIDGVHVDERVLTFDNTRISPNTLVSASSDDSRAIFQVGGFAVEDTFSTQQSTNVGLGEIYMRNVFIMNGHITPNEVVHLATSGITDSVPTGFNTTQDTTEVNINDTALEGYYRFTGGVFGRGTKDLSNNSNDLTDIAKIYKDGGNFVSPTDNAFDNLRFFPGPFKNG
jgi:hypothetical protein